MDGFRFFFSVVAHITAYSNSILTHPKQLYVFLSSTLNVSNHGKLHLNVFVFIRIEIHGSRLWLICVA